MSLVDIDYVEAALEALHVLNASFSYEAIRGPVDACLRFVNRLFLTIFDIAYLMEQFLVDTYLRFLTGFLLFLLNTGIIARRFALLEHRRCETQQDKWTAQVEAWWNEVNFKNFKKLLRVFNLMEPLPTDLIPVNTFLPVKKPKRQTGWWSNGFRSPEWDRPNDEVTENVERVEPVPRGFVRVVLRFRYGDLHQRLRGEDWSLANMNYSVTRDLQLEKDGSLKTERMREAFHIDDIDFLVPDRQDLFEPARDDKISKLSIYTLSYKFGAIHVIEREDIFCRMRRRLRFWLRSSLISYIIRNFLYYSASWIIRTSLMCSMAWATKDILKVYVVLATITPGIWVWQAKANVVFCSLFIGAYSWRFLGLFASRMGLQKLVPQRRMKHWSKQIEKLIY